MDTSLIVERTLDTGEILRILLNDQIFDAISEDPFKKEDLRVDVQTDIWLRAVVDDVTIGVVQFIPKFNKCFDGHIHILPEYRREHALKAGEGIMDWLRKNMKGCTIYTNTPEYCGNVRAFLRGFEFQENGRIPRAWLKNGILNDLIIMTRFI